MKQQKSNNNQEKIYQYNVFHNIFGEIVNSPTKNYSPNQCRLFDIQTL